MSCDRSRTHVIKKENIRFDKYKSNNKHIFHFFSLNKIKSFINLKLRNKVFNLFGICTKNQLVLNKILIKFKGFLAKKI